MKAKLRHPIRGIREPFGTAGLIVAVIALVLALSGAAFAAAGLSGKQKKEVEKIAKKVAGKAGANGAPGAQGPAGPQGAEGQPGTNGKNGSNGKSVVTGTATQAECAEGGATVEVEGSTGTKKHVCNGQPWTAGGTLPSGRTLEGEWNADSIATEPFTAIRANGSYALPLATAPTPVYASNASQATGTGNLVENSAIVANVQASAGEFTKGSIVSGSGVPAGTKIAKVLGSETLELSAEATATATAVALTAGLPAGCTGDAVEPGAEPGFLCVFGRGEESAEQLLQKPQFTSLQPRIGFTLVAASTEPAGTFISFHGTWAVTAK